MKTKLLYSAVWFGSAMLVACGGSSSSGPNNGNPGPTGSAPSTVIDLTKTNEGLYLAARFALDNSLFWEHFVGASTSKIEDADWEISDEGHYFEPCFDGDPVTDTAQVFDKKFTVYQCNDEIEFGDAFNAKDTKVTGVKVGESQWLGYYSFSGGSDNTPYVSNSDIHSAKTNVELSVEVNSNRGSTTKSQRTYFVDMKQTDTFGEYVRDETLKLGASRGAPFEVFVQDGFYEIEGPISLALRQGSIECHFSIDSLKTVEPPALKFELDSDPEDPELDSLELVAVRGGELNLDNSIIAFADDGISATVDGMPVDLKEVEMLFNQCGWEDD